MRTSDAIDQLATALAKAQGAMKNATLNKNNPHFKSRYADLAEIRDTVTPALSQNGIATVQGTDIGENHLIVWTRLIHTSGQWIESQFPVPFDKPQAMGSGITYGRRYTLSAVTSIAADEDDDGNVANDRASALAASASISAEQFRTLQQLIESTGTDAAKLLAFVKAESLETMTVAQFRNAEAALRKKQNQSKPEAA